MKAEAAKRLAEVRKRVDEANRKATEDKKLCNRTAFAIDYLYKLKDMAYLIKAMNDLGENYNCLICLRKEWLTLWLFYSYQLGVSYMRSGTHSWFSTSVIRDSPSGVSLWRHMPLEKSLQYYASPQNVVRQFGDNL